MSELERLLEEGRAMLQRQRDQERERGQAALHRVLLQLDALKCAVCDVIPPEFHEFLDWHYVHNDDGTPYLPFDPFVSLVMPGLAPIRIRVSGLDTVAGRLWNVPDQKFSVPIGMRIESTDGDNPYYIRHTWPDAADTMHLAKALAMAEEIGAEYQAMRTEVDQLNAKAQIPDESGASEAQQAEVERYSEQAVCAVDHLAEARRLLFEVGDYDEESYYQYAPVELQEVQARVLLVIAELLVNWTRHALPVQQV